MITLFIENADNAALCQEATKKYASKPRAVLRSKIGKKIVIPNYIIIIIVIVDTQLKAGKVILGFNSCLNISAIIVRAFNVL